MVQLVAWLGKATADEHLPLSYACSLPFFQCRISTESSLVHKVVRQYLLHYGYGDTLKALNQDAGLGLEGEGAPEAGSVHAGVEEGAGGDAAMEMDGGPCGMLIDEESPVAAAAAEAEVETAAASIAAAASGGGPASVGPGSAPARAEEGGGMCSGSGASWQRDGALELRQAVRLLVMRGDIRGAVERIRQVAPQILDGGTGFEMVSFHLATQQYIELVRWVRRLLPGTSAQPLEP
jgi:hypothetical protein